MSIDRRILDLVSLKEESAQKILEFLGRKSLNQEDIKELLQEFINYRNCVKLLNERNVLF